MTQTKTVVAPLLIDNLEAAANPYNANKDWQNEQIQEVQDAGSLFYEPQPTVAPVEPEDPSATSTDPDVEDKDNHNYKKRWVDLKNHYDTKTQEWKDRLAQYESGEVSNIPFTAPKTEEELESFKKENPEFYAFMESIAHQRSQEDSSIVDTKLTEIEKRERKLAKNQALKEILETHSDFNIITNSEDFHDWAKTQPKGIQEWIYNNPTDSSLAIRAIDLYKADVMKIEARVESTNEVQAEAEDAASLVSLRPTDAAAEGGKKIWTQEEISQLTADQYDHLEAEIDLAIQEGRVQG